MKHYCNPKDGELNFESPSDWKKHIKSLRPRRHVVEIKEYHDTRTKGANAYYFAVVVPHFLKEMGHAISESTKEYMHYSVLGMELRLIDDPDRPGQKMIQQTRTMDGSTFWKYIYRCEALSIEYKLGSFPPPKSLGYDTNKR